ncbi:MAG TPA: hypothetical protein VLH40_10085 [Atribacteraceae bacterium]|nr:hypothetical protein [Atribacteraceae bacterium]
MFFRCPLAHADVLIPAMARIDREMICRGKNLRLIQQWGAGLEGVDREAATELGIAVANVPTAGTGNAESVAELGSHGRDGPEPAIPGNTTVGPLRCSPGNPLGTVLVWTDCRDCRSRWHW